MKPHLLLSLSLVILFSGCADRSAQVERVRQEAEAEARADAARDQMNAVPMAIRSREYFKRNESENRAPAASESAQEKP